MRGAGAIIGVFALSLAGCLDVLAGEPLIRSRDGRLQALPIPDGLWCAEVVGLRMEGTDDWPRKDPAFVQKFLAGVRAAVTAECPRAEGVRVHFEAPGGDTFRAWANKAAKWTWRTSDTQRALDEAGRRDVADVEARRLNLMAGANVSAYLKPAEAAPSNAGWRVANVTAGLLLSAGETGQPLGVVADNAAGFAARQCISPRIATARAPSDNVVVRTIVCDAASGCFSWSFIGWNAGAERFVLGMHTARCDWEATQNVTVLTEGYERVVSGDW